MGKIYNFDTEKYLEDGVTSYQKREDVEKLAVEIAKGGFDNIYLMGIGGTEFELYHLYYMLDKYFDVDISLISAADYFLKKDKKLTDKSLVVTASSSGNTVELIKAVKEFQKRGVRVVSFTKLDSELAKYSTHVVEEAAVTGKVEFSYLLQTIFLYKILNEIGQFDDYNEFADQLKGIFKDLVGIRETFDKRADFIASKIYDAEHTIFTASGALWGECLLYSMCILEEMQWIRTRPVTSSLFFHGTLELVEENVPVFIIKGEDEFREQDNRVENFCKKINAEHYVFDTQEFALNSIDDKFRKFLTPWIATALLTERMGRNYAKYTNHNLEYRRYYRQFEY